MTHMREGRLDGKHVRTDRGSRDCPFKLLPNQYTGLGRKSGAADIYFRHSVCGLDMSLTLLLWKVRRAVLDDGISPCAHQNVHESKETAENIWDSRQDVRRTMPGLRVRVLIGLSL